MYSRTLAALSAALLVPALAVPALPAFAQDAGQAVSFTAAQARRGNLVFQQSCASCHGDRLGGMLENPALAGKDFQSHWWGQPVSALYGYLSTAMPLDAPGSLTPEQYADITAFILSKNGIEANDEAGELPADTAAQEALMLPAVPAE